MIHVKINPLNSEDYGNCIVCINIHSNIKWIVLCHFHSELWIVTLCLWLNIFDMLLKLLFPFLLLSFGPQTLKYSNELRLNWFVFVQKSDYVVRQMGYSLIYNGDFYRHLAHIFGSVVQNYFSVCESVSISTFNNIQLDDIILGFESEMCQFRMFECILFAGN